MTGYCGEDGFPDRQKNTNTKKKQELLFAHAFLDSFAVSWIHCLGCIPTIPGGIAAVAAAPAGHSERLQPSEFGHQADPEEAGLPVESESGSVHPAEPT